VPWIIIIAWLHAVMLIATARVAIVSTVRRIVAVSIRLVSLIAVLRMSARR
jgi:hypothetical protein